MCGGVLKSPAGTVSPHGSDFSARAALIGVAVRPQEHHRNTLFRSVFSNVLNAFV